MDEILPRTMIESIQIFAVMIGILAQVLIINWWTIFPMLVMGSLYWQIRNIYLKTAQNMKRFEGSSEHLRIHYPDTMQYNIINYYLCNF